MKIETLPVGSAPVPVEYPYFPTRWQHVLWRNWGVVDLEVLAEVLQCEVSELSAAAEELGLPPVPEVSEKWKTHGYLTVIRNNWQLLNYEQLLKILDWTPEKLAYSLKEEDFLYIKLGSLKPDCPVVHYAPLSDSEKAATAEIKAVVNKYFTVSELNYAEKPFAFADKFAQKKSVIKEQKFDFNFIHSYAASCGDVLGEAEVLDPVPENLLAQYASMGIKGVWMHALLYLLSPIDGAEEYSAGWEKRLANLKRIVTTCGKYGIKVFLYLNEPRCLPHSFYDKKPHWRGIESQDNITVCINRTPEVLEWLENSVRKLFTEVPELGGLFNIAMSEYPTHCNYRHGRSRCPYCKDMPADDFIVRINSAIERGMHSVAPDAKLLMYDWAWQEKIHDSMGVDEHVDYEEFSKQTVKFKCRILDQIPQNDNIYVNSVSEWGLNTHVGGVAQRLVDYSISQIGPAPEAVSVWKHARNIGLGVCAKVQINNSWELSAIPYIPVPYLIEEHLNKLKAAGVQGLMLSWTLGGFPGGNLELLSATPEEIAHGKFHDELAVSVCEAWKLFSDAFREFPFHVDTIYNGPMNYGPMNQLHLKPTGYQSSMVGFPYDDLKVWRAVYPEEIFENQFKLLTEKWREGLQVLDAVKSTVTEAEKADFVELYDMAVASYCHFRSTYLQIVFVRARNNGFDRERMKMCAAEELELALRLYEIARRDSRIGFEASNHYYYTLNDLREKVVNCCSILDKLQA